MTYEARKFGPGYQGSETSSAEAFIYAQGDDKILAPPKLGKYTLLGRKASDEVPALIAVSTTKTLGAASGTFQLTLKAPANLLASEVGRRYDLSRLFMDDDWVDIVFTRHGKRWHVMRGLIDRIQRTTAVLGNGATTEAFVIQGRDFGKIFEDTQIWFNSFTSENVGGGSIIQAYESVHSLFGAADVTVHTFLFAFLKEINKVGRETWETPPGMPPFARATPFVRAVTMFADGFTDDPQRIAVRPNWLELEQTSLWNLAQQWSDPMFCELWTDLIDGGGEGGKAALCAPDDEIDIPQTQMAVIFRNRPFPTSALLGGLQPTENSPWFSLPTAIVPRQSIVHEEIGRGGQERANAFLVTTTMLAEGGQQYIQLAQPLWNKADILRHGVRRMDVQSSYTAANDDLLNLSRVQRSMVRDWHCLNPYLYNGSLSLGHGRPDIRVGMRLRIPGVDPSLDETYYVESVSHSWEHNTGIRTTLGVTRGWVGTDRSYIAALYDQQTAYNDGEAYEMTKPADFVGPPVPPPITSQPGDYAVTQGALGA